MTKSRTIRWILPIAALVVVGYFGWQRLHGTNPTAADTAQKSAASARGAAVPVTVAPVTKADFPVYLGGLGTFNCLNNVLVRTLVGSQIAKLPFTSEKLC